MKSRTMGAVSALLLTNAGLAQAEDGEFEPKGPSVVDEAPPKGDNWPRPGEKPSSFGIFIEPLFAPFGFYEGDVLVSITNDLAVGVGAQYFDFTLGDVSFSGFGLTAGVQIFPLSSGQTFDGFYVYPTLKYFKAETTVKGASAETVDGTDEVASVTYIGPQVIVGYQWDWHPFSVRLGGGLEYSFGKLDENFTNDSADLSGIGIETDLTIGFTF